jgi:DNA-binding GntR family transcriptional regulator
MVLRMSLAEGDTLWESHLIAKHHILDPTPQYDAEDPGRVSDEWSLAHADFHDALLAGCRNSRLLSIATTLRDSAELYRSWSQQQARHPNRDVLGEHRNLMELALARDSEAAVRAPAAPRRSCSPAPNPEPPRPTRLVPHDHRLANVGLNGPDHA